MTGKKNYDQVSKNTFQSIVLILTHIQLLKHTEQISPYNNQKETMHSIPFILLLLALSFQIPNCNCLGNWTWMYGENTRNSVGVYGEKGVPNPSNYPRARQYGTISYDKNSNTLWLFGGNSAGEKLTRKFRF
jgi:hypothetical protein